MPRARRSHVIFGHACVDQRAEEGWVMHMAAKPQPWTIEKMYRLPDDGNKYEVVRGELFVTPPPTDHHETIAARLTTILSPYVVAKGLGLVYHPRAVMQFEGSEVEPDSWCASNKPHRTRPGRKRRRRLSRSCPRARAGAIGIRSVRFTSTLASRNIGSSIQKPERSRPSPRARPA